MHWMDINLLVVSRDKCNNDIKMENSTGNLPIINRACYIAGPKKQESVCPYQWTDKT